MSAEIEIRPTTYAEWYALEEERDQLRAELDRLSEQGGETWLALVADASRRMGGRA